MSIGAHRGGGGFCVDVDLLFVHLVRDRSSTASSSAAETHRKAGGAYLHEAID